MKNFLFPKKITSVGSSALDQPTLVIFLTFLEKNYNDWIKCKLSKSKLRWTGLKKFGVFKDFLMYFTIIGPSKIGCFVGFSLQTNLGFLYTVVVRYPLVSSNVTSIPNIVRISLVDNVEQLIVIFVIHTFCYVMKIKGHYNNLCIK